ncbi:hypothetical protein SNEBB_003330 [Seison nebaliae]|nr:hypothetical protein SNEBB_003330 [Seison nebaliae]
MGKSKRMNNYQIFHMNKDIRKSIYFRKYYKKSSSTFTPTTFTSTLSFGKRPNDSNTTLIGSPGSSGKKSLKNMNNSNDEAIDIEDKSPRELTTTPILRIEKRVNSRTLSKQPLPNILSKDSCVSFPSITSCPSSSSLTTSLNNSDEECFQQLKKDQLLSPSPYKNSESIGRCYKKNDKLMKVHLQQNTTTASATCSPDSGSKNDLNSFDEVKRSQSMLEDDEVKSMKYIGDIVHHFCHRKIIDRTKIMSKYEGNVMESPLILKSPDQDTLYHLFRYKRTPTNKKDVVDNEILQHNFRRSNSIKRAHNETENQKNEKRINDEEKVKDENVHHLIDTFQKCESIDTTMAKKICRIDMSTGNAKRRNGKTRFGMWGPETIFENDDMEGNSNCLPSIEEENKENEEIPSRFSRKPTTDQQKERHVEISMSLNNLIGDNSLETFMPTIESSKNPGLYFITPEQLVEFMKFCHDRQSNILTPEYVIIDCRYPYEYEGGHIKNAVNVYTTGMLQKLFMERPKVCQNCNNRFIIIFHCEFSSERGPQMARDLRHMDRDLHRASYPNLYYPEIYVLKGGYKTFYEKGYVNYCQPQSYLRMHHPSFSQEYLAFRDRALLSNQCFSGMTTNFKARRPIARMSSRPQLIKAQSINEDMVLRRHKIENKCKANNDGSIERRGMNGARVSPTSFCYRQSERIVEGREESLINSPFRHTPNFLRGDKPSIDLSHTSRCMRRLQF